MYKTFNKIITFHVEGEIEDKNTSPESIINNYDWSFSDSFDGNIQIFGHHKDSRGRITKMTKLPKIHNWSSKDTQFFAEM